MQVKKFEARTMKEALEMVKRDLGPEAIILNAKDNNRSYGLAGQGSIEVTAAISDETFRRKRMAESKLSQALKDRYNQIPARVQRDFIAKANSPRVEEFAPPQAPAKPLRYADILDESPTLNVPAPSEERVKNAAQRAFQALNESAVAPAKPPRQLQPQTKSTVEIAEVKELKAQITQLRQIIEGFQKVPQSFVTMHPGADYGICYELSASYQKLLRAGVSIENTVEMLRVAQNVLPKDQMQKTAFVDAWIAKYLMDQTQVASQRTEARFHLFFGPGGQGKTSALVKLAGHMVICEKKRIAIVTTDTQKVGASEQLRIYSQILNIPFAVVRNAGDWTEVKNRLVGVDHILVDFPGLNLKSIQEIDHLRTLIPQSEQGVASHYVQSVLANDESALEIASRYQMIGFTDVIFTGLDEAAQHGLIYNFIKKFNVPLHSFGVGRQIPEDLEPATKERVVDLLFKLSKVRKEKSL